MNYFILGSILLCLSILSTVSASVKDPYVKGVKSTVILMCLIAMFLAAGYLIGLGLSNE